MVLLVILAMIDRHSSAMNRGTPAIWPCLTVCSTVNGAGPDCSMHFFYFYFYFVDSACVPPILFIQS